MVNFPPHAPASAQPDCFVVALRDEAHPGFAVVRTVSCEHLDGILGEKGENVVAASQQPLTRAGAKRFMEQLPNRKIALTDLETSRQQVSAQFLDILKDVMSEGW